MIALQETSGGYRTLVYADLGPRLSGKQPRCQAPWPIDDDKMQYASINHHLSNNPSEVISASHKLDSKDMHPAGIILYQIISMHAGKVDSSIS